MFNNDDDYTCFKYRTYLLVLVVFFATEAQSAQSAQSFLYVFCHLDRRERSPEQHENVWEISPCARNDNFIITLRLRASAVNYLFRDRGCALS